MAESDSDPAASGPPPAPRRRPKKAAGPRTLADGRRQVTTWLSPELIRAAKLAGVERDLPLARIVEVALEEWLARQHRPSGS